MSLEDKDQVHEVVEPQVPQDAPLGHEVIPESSEGEAKGTDDKLVDIEIDEKAEDAESRESELKIPERYLHAEEVQPVEIAETNPETALVKADFEAPVPAISPAIQSSLQSDYVGDVKADIHTESIFPVLVAPAPQAEETGHKAEALATPIAEPLENPLAVAPLSQSAEVPVSTITQVQEKPLAEPVLFEKNESARQETTVADSFPATKMDENTLAKVNIPQSRPTPTGRANCGRCSLL